MPSRWQRSLEKPVKPPGKTVVQLRQSELKVQLAFETVSAAVLVVLPNVAVRLMLDDLAPAAALISNVALLWPEEIVTVAGTVTELLSQVTVMTRPATPAGALSSMTPVAEPPAFIVSGCTLMEARVNGLIERDSDWEAFPNVAVIFAVVSKSTATVLTAKVAEVFPTGTFTLD